MSYRIALLIRGRMAYAGTATDWSYDANGKGVMAFTAMQEACDYLQENAEAFWEQGIHVVQIASQESEHA